MINFGNGILFVFLFFIAGVAHGKDSGDRILGFKKRDDGVILTRRRSVSDYQGARHFLDSSHNSVRILVTTREGSPDGQLYSIAEAVSGSLKETFPNTSFRVLGRGDLDQFVNEISSGYDYIFLVGVNSLASKYDSEKTIYSSRSTGFRCSSGFLEGDVDCKESSSSYAPIGSRSVKRSIFTDIFYVTYGFASDAIKSYSENVQNGTRGWQVSLSEPIGNTSFEMIYGSDESSWCENVMNAQVSISAITGINLVSAKPDIFSVRVAPKKIGCNE